MLGETATVRSAFTLRLGDLANITIELRLELNVRRSWRLAELVVRGCEACPIHLDIVAAEKERSRFTVRRGVGVPPDCVWS